MAQKAQKKKAPAPADAQKEIAALDNAVKQDGVTLTVTVSEAEYQQILHAVEVAGYSDVDEWLSATVRDAM